MPKSEYCANCGHPVGKGNVAEGDEDFVHYSYMGGDNEDYPAFARNERQDDLHTARPAMQHGTLQTKQFGNRR